MIKTFLYTCGISALLFMSAALGVLFYVTEQPWVDLSTLEHYNPGKPSILLDDEGNEWGRFQLDKRDIIKLSNIPKHLIDAFLAAEDWNFFKHQGISFKGIARSIIVNITNVRKAQGASTITQQLVRLLYFSPQKSISRKVKEQLLAIVVERQFTKEQILETYLNHIYLGSGIYGVEAASQRFWGKPVSAITLDEAAVLASIVRSPKFYCPLYNPSAAQGRRNLILKNMFTLGFIKKDAYETARAKPVTIIQKGSQTCAPYVKEMMRIFLEETVGKERLYTGGLIIKTTLNKKIQDAAEKAFQKHITTLKKQFSPDLQGALYCIEGETGAVKGLVGGTDYMHSQFNRAIQARRQMGSTFKPLVYANALAEGKTFSELERDEPFSLTFGNKEWSPNNYKDTFAGLMTRGLALTKSNNIIAIKTFLSTNADNVVRLSQACGLKGADPYPALALGAIDATLKEAVCMMNVFATQGMLVEPYMIEWIKDEWGTKLWKAQAAVKKKVMSSTISSQVAHILTHKIDKAKKKNPNQWFKCAAFGKTGTTNDSRTCWFVGATPKYTTGVYIGYDDNRPLGKRVLGSQVAFPLWKEFNNAIKQDTMNFSFDPTLKEITINGITGAPCAPDDPEALPLLVP